MTDESPELVQEWLARAKPTYPIAIAKGEFERQVDVKYFPFCAVIAPDGSISYAGSAGMEESELGAAMSSSKKAPLWPKSLSKLTKTMTGDPIKAYGELKKLVEGGKLTSEEQPHVDGFIAYLEGQAKTALSDAKALSEKGHVFKAMKKVEAYSTAQPAFPSSADSAAFVKELQALPEFKKELAGGEAYLAAEQLEKDHEYLDAFEAYKALAKKFAGTKIAENAKAKAEQIRSDGLPGFEPACESCGQAGRACAKHKKEVKL